MRRQLSLRSLNGPEAALLDSNVFLSYIKGDDLADYSERVVDATLDGRLRAYVSSELCDDVVTALRSRSVPPADVKAVLRGIASIPHESLPVTPSIALTALELYERHEGQRRMHYFDSFHVATSIHHDLPMITSDSYIIENQGELNLKVISLRQVEF